MSSKTFGGKWDLLGHITPLTIICKIIYKILSGLTSFLFGAIRALRRSSGIFCRSRSLKTSAKTPADEIMKNYSYLNERLVMEKLS